MFGEPNGNRVWKDLIHWYETSQATEIMTNSILKAIESLSFKDSGSQTMGGISNEYNHLLFEHGKYCGPETFTEAQKLRRFKEGLAGSSKYSILLDLAEVHQYDLRTL